jgi:hypothetical protein
MSDPCGHGEHAISVLPMPVMAGSEDYPSLLFARGTPFDLEFITS